ncbi:MAG: metallophosphoesterase [Sandaracinaceae bacterium]
MPKDELFAIGDIHGCAEELVALIESLPLTKDSTLVTLGDYVDRGPDARGVIETLLAMRERCHVVSLRGNHEELFLDYLDHDDEKHAAKFVLNGGGATLRSYVADGSTEVRVPREHIEFIRGLPHCYETDDYFFVHAGVPDVPLETIDVEEHGPFMLWARGRFLDSTFKWDKRIVHGHTAMPDPTVLPHRVNLDTGCAYGGRLTAMGFPSETVYTVAQRPNAGIRPSSGDERRDTLRRAGQLPVWVDSEGGPVRMMSVNYSSSGLLVEQEKAEVPFPLAAKITGRIEIDETTQLMFRGRIARRYRARSRVCYGIQFSEVAEIPRSA